MGKELGFFERLRFPDHKKNFIAMVGGQLKRGIILYNRALVQEFEPTPLVEADKLRLVIDAANSLRVPPYEIQKRLDKGESVFYRDFKKK